MATEEISSLSCVKVIDESTERMFLDACFESVEEHGYELLDVLLHHDIDRLAEGLVRHAEGIGHEIHSSRSFQITENTLNLMEDVIVNWSVLAIHGPDRGFLIVNSQQEVSEVTVHKELLDHRVHIANIAQILQSGVAIGRALIDFRGVCDANSTDARVYSGKCLSDYFIGQFLIILAYLEDELIYGLTSGFLFTGSLSPEQTALPEQLHLTLSHLRPQMEIGQQLGTSFYGQLIPFVKDVPEQDFRHG